MELITKLCWLGLALIHLTPSLVLFRPALTQSLYGVPASGDLGVLLVHRGGLFLAVLVACLYAGFAGDGRRLAVLVVAISMISFLWLYFQAGLPTGSLRKIAIADVVGVPLLVFVGIRAFVSN